MDLREINNIIESHQQYRENQPYICWQDREGIGTPVQDSTLYHDQEWNLRKARIHLGVRGYRRFFHVYPPYVGRDKEYGDAIIACPRVFTVSPPDLSQSFHDGYFIFYPVTAAVAQGLAHVVGHFPSPGMPARFRRAGAPGWPAHFDVDYSGRTSRPRQSGAVRRNSGAFR